MDALANLFAFDSKFYLSIWPLMRYPGRLSLEVVKGRKTTYLPPIRLFLLVTIITLMTSSLLQRCERGWNDIDHLRKQDEKVLTTTPDTANLNGIAVADSLPKGQNRLTFSNDKYGNYLSNIYNFIQEHPKLNPDEGLDSLGMEANFWNRFWYTNLLKISLMSKNEYLSFWRSNILIILLLFIPILALVLKLLYFYKKQYYYVDHFVFSLHTQAAFMVFMTLYLILGRLIDNTALLLPLLIFPIYLLLALKNFYKQRWFYTIVNYLIINVTFFAVSGIFLLLVGIVSFLLI